MNVNNGARPPLVPQENRAEVERVSSTQQFADCGQRLAASGLVPQAHTPPAASSDQTPVNPQWPPEEFDPDYVLPEGPGWASRFSQGRSAASPDTLPSLSLQHRLPPGTAEGAMREGRQRHDQTPPHHAGTVTVDSLGSCSWKSEIADYARGHLRETDKQIARVFDVSPRTVYGIRRDFGVPNTLPRPVSTDARRREIADYARIHPGNSDNHIATIFDVSQNTVTRIRRAFDVPRIVPPRIALTDARRREVADYARIHADQSREEIANRFGLSRTRTDRICRAAGVRGTSGAAIVRPALGSFQSSRSLRAESDNQHIQRFLQQLQRLPARPVVMPPGDLWASLPVGIRRDVYGNDRSQFEREATQAATDHDRIDAALAQSGMRVVRNDGDRNNCLLISLLQHATGDYSQNHLTRAYAIRNLLIAERLIRRNEPMLFTGPETRRAVEIINGNSAVTPPLRVYSISDVAGTLAVDRVDFPYRDSRDVLIWDKGGHFEAIARQ
ncbi:hypothetical protein PQR14_20835 [Paraburkholderia bryophila]|uniref:hypothetical protein n=1 Tax=Paraburkholderia bryophila TaxID=420952 RepID=UPI0038BD50C9